MLFECPADRTLSAVVDGRCVCTRCGRTLRLDAEEVRYVEKRAKARAGMTPRERRESDKLGFAIP